MPFSYCVHSFKFNLSINHPGYLLIECIERSKGEMLSNTWLQKQRNDELRENFSRGFSRLLLSMSRIPLPHIGWFVIHSYGYLTLTNLPLTMVNALLEIRMHSSSPLCTVTLTEKLAFV